MKSAVKIWIIIASVLVIVGVAVFSVALSINGGFEMKKYLTKTYDKLDNFNEIYINTTTADINFLKSTDGKAKVVCYEDEKEPHIVEVKGGKLSIEVQNNRKWYDYISFGFRSPNITVYLPNEDYGALSVKSSTGNVSINKDFTFSTVEVTGSTGDVNCYASASEIKIHLSTGDIEVEGVTAKNLDLKVSTGEIEVENVSVENDINIKFSTDDTSLQNVTSKNLTINGGTGDIDLNNVVLSGKMNITASTGDVYFYKSDASEIKVDVSTGDVKGSLLSSKIFMVDTGTGKKLVPKTTEGGVCEITTSTGDIIITIAN